MIKNRLKILLAERDLNYSKLSEITGISINALSKMGKEGGTGSKQITYEVLEKICSALKCQVGDLLIWVPEEKK
ncbi:MAG: helix-turn-helix domain-containing protein [bacterium]